MVDIGDDEPQVWKFDTTVPHSARIWNYWLGGKDNFGVDREAGDKFLEVYPGIRDVARGVRGFLGRAVTYLAGEAGVRQFLDIGTGLPTADNTHEVAQRVAPESRIVYADNDPLVLAHARALLTSSPEGSCRYLDADVRDPDAIVTAAKETLDFSQPVAVIMLGIMGHIHDDDEALSLVHRITAALPSGGYLVLSDGANTSAARQKAHDEYKETGAAPYQLRSPAQLAKYFDGLDLLDPGVVSVTEWRPGDNPSPHVDTYGGMAKKA
ncbi:MAG: SAM-dependent methyltransferase [Streptosporangiales bacterium]|nr:SAM-dependent methyltransferase [Streptosporangiales bacterium]